MKDYESLHRFASDRLPVLKLELVDGDGTIYDKVVPLCSTSTPLKEAKDYLYKLPDRWFDRITSAKVATCDLLYGYYSNSNDFASLDEDEICEGFFEELVHKVRRERHLRKVADYD